MTDAPILIAALVIATIWGVYLFPHIFGRQSSAPLNSTEQFDRWTHVMADVQRRAYTSKTASARDSVRQRRRRALVVLLGLAVVTLGVSFAQNSVVWLIIHLAVDALVAIYVGVLLQVKQREAGRLAHDHLVERPHDADQPPVRIVANS